MKALKQKRISLRSLWRRGLVILSLFALVFASCSDSEGSSSEGSGGEAPYAMQIITGPSNYSYQGQPVDLTGVAVQVFYPSGRSQTITNVNSFSTEPKLATGYYSKDVGFVGKRNYKLLVSVGGRAFTGDILLPWTDWFDQSKLTSGVNWAQLGFHNGVIGITRENTTDATPDTPGNPNNPIDRPIYSTQGLQITGTMRTRSYYVDDEVDFGGLVAEANYYNGIKLPISLNLQDIEWGLYPHYDNGNETGTGSLYITVGRNLKEGVNVLGNEVKYYPQLLLDQWPVIDFNLDNTAIFAQPTSSGWSTGSLSTVLADDLVLDPGVTGIVAISQIYHVTNLEFEVAPTFEPLFYWQPDNWYFDPDGVDGPGMYNPWIWRARDCGTVIRPTYSNGQSKKFTIDQALAQNPVWWNENTTTSPDLNFILMNPTIGDVPSVPFDIVGVQNSGISKTYLNPGPHHFQNRDPHINFYYRGHRLRVDMPVYTRYMSLNVASKVGETPEISMARRDNDNLNIINDKVFSEMLTVTAEYSAYSNPDLTATIELDYDSVVANSLYGTNVATAGRYQASGTHPDEGSFYTMNFGTNKNKWLGTAAAYTGGATADDWGQCDNPNNNGRERPVTIFYAVPSYASPTTPPYSYAGRDVSGRIQVAWSDID